MIFRIGGAFRVLGIQRDCERILVGVTLNGFRSHVFTSSTLLVAGVSGNSPNLRTLRTKLLKVNVSQTGTARQDHYPDPLPHQKMYIRKKPPSTI